MEYMRLRGGIMLSEHPNLKDLPQDDECGLWIFNYIFYMMDLFDTKQEIKEIKIESLNKAEGTLEKYRVDVIKCPIKHRKRVSKTTNHYQYCLYIDKDFAQECYNEQMNDSTISVNYLEIVILHELAHLRYFQHNKKFFRYWLRLIKKWLRYKGVDEDGFYVDYIKRDKRRYKKGYYSE